MWYLVSLFRTPTLVSFILFPEGSIGSIFSYAGGFMDGERGVYERLWGGWKLYLSCVCFEVLANWFVGGGCVKDSGRNMEDNMIVRFRGSSPTESGK